MEEKIDTSTKKFSAKPKPIDRPMSAIKKMMMQKQESKEQENKTISLPFECPYNNCGRKFFTAEKLQEHIERKLISMKNDTTPHPKGTPLPVKAKIVGDKIGEEQQRYLKEIVKRKKPVDYKPRPATSYVPQTKPK